MRDAWTIATKDLRRRLRDRTAILVALVLPFGLAWIFSLTLGDVEMQGLEATYAVVNQDAGGDLPASFAELLKSLDFVTLKEVDSLAQAERQAESGDLDAVAVFPEGFSDAVRAGDGATIRVIGSPDSTIGSLVMVSLAGSFGSQLDAVGLSVATVTHGGGAGATVPADPDLATRARSVPAAARVRTVDAADQVASQSTFFAIGMAVFFLFFAVEFGVRGLLEEREDGTLSRLLVAPIEPSSVIGGKALASLVVGVVSTVLLVLATTWLLHAEWGDPLGVASLIVGGVLAAVGVTALVATYAKTTAQAGAMVSIVAVVGGLLGGTFFPISQAGVLGSVRFLSPQGWLMEGFQKLAYGASVGGIAWPLAGVFAIALVTGGLAWVRSTRMVAR
jgi:linearmycin/streptolysin S transport system permease protein